MNHFKKLVGERIYLSPKGTSEELQKFTEWMNDFQVMDYTWKTAGICTLSGEKEWLEKSSMNSKSRTFDIVTLDENKLIGTVGLEKFNWIERSAVLGIFIGDKDYRNNGYGTETIPVKEVGINDGLNINQYYSKEGMQQLLNDVIQGKVNPKKNYNSKTYIAPENLSYVDLSPILNRNKVIESRSNSRREH